MMFRLLIFLLIFSACQRKSAPEHNGIDFDIDSTAQLLPKSEIPQNALIDVHNLLRMGHEKADKNYDSLVFRLYLDQKLQDSIRIHTSGENTVYLTIGNPKNHTVALYSYLDHQGYRFYGPDDHWTYIPPISSIPLIDTTIMSSFAYRSINPSYGVTRANIKILDTTKHLFDRWKNRLRMVNLINIPAGHYGSTFNRKFRKQIEANPLWRGKDSKGNIRNWSVNLKLCYNNPEVINLYRTDALERVRKLQKTSTGPYIINIEPPDGGGFCKCNDCKNQTVSDQVYNLANKVAAHIYKYDTCAMVSLYAYNMHASTPSFSLNKNVLVGVVPFALQGVGSPETVMRMWEETGAKLFLRDYLAIPDWTLDQPTYIPNGRFLSKINHIKSGKYLGYNFETTTSFMSVGLQFSLLSEASWKTIDGINYFNAFLDIMFPGIQEEVGILLENLPRLDERTFYTAHQSINNLLEKVDSSENKSLVQRLRDIKYYIEYLYLLSQFNKSQNEENTNLLIDKILSKPGLRLLHPYGLIRTIQRKKDISRKYYLSENKSVSIPPPNGVQLELRRRTAPEYKALFPDFYIDSIDWFKPIFLRNTSAILYVGESMDGVVKLKANLKKLNSSAAGTIIIRDLSGTHIRDIKLLPDNQWHEYEFTLSQGKFYLLRFQTPGSELQLKGPNRPFAFNTPLYTRYLHKQVPFYFHIPPDKSKVRIKIPLQSNRVIVNAHDEMLYDLHKEPSYTLDIINKQDQIIEIIMFRHGLQLLNIPQLISTHPKAVISRQQ